MTNFDGMYHIRASTPGDRNFILKSFLLGLYHGDSWFSEIPKDIFMAHYKGVIANIVDNPNNLTVIACLPEDSTVILGYAILSDTGDTLHWTYVKKPWRRRGIMTRIIPQAVNTVTHLTELGRTLKKKMKPNAIFNPFKL